MSKPKPNTMDGLLIMDIVAALANDDALTLPSLRNLKALITTKLQEADRAARVSELEKIAEQYGEFRDETTGKSIDLKAVTLYRIKHRLNSLKGGDV